MSPQNRLKWLLVTQKCQKFPGASPLDPIGGLTAPPTPQLLGLASLVTRYARVPRFARFTRYAREHFLLFQL